MRRTSNYTADKGIYTDTTKTKKSQRSQKFPEYVMDMLKELKAEQDKERIRLGDKWIETDRLFVKWDGRPMHNNTPYFWFTEFCEKNNVRFCDIHSLRHFAASALISSGLDVVTVPGALGHCNSGTTLNIYSHMFQTAQAKVAQAMDGAFSFIPQ
ncbi:tyrosine-type recombinase/integrase, partial [Ruminococcus sp.]|uniref:tyrosine-type recombinase/integrase n=1 Tax=Ruminococcus sp. TaxID=41978 RepID=UPI0025F22436